MLEKILPLNTMLEKILLVNTMLEKILLLTTMLEKTLAAHVASCTSISSWIQKLELTLVELELDGEPNTSTSTMDSIMKQPANFES